MRYTVTFCLGLNFQYKTEGEIEGLFRLFNRQLKLFDDLRMQNMPGVKGNNHADVVLEINPVAAFAAHQPETCFDQEFSASEAVRRGSLGNAHLKA